MAKPVIAPGDQPPASTHNEWFINVNYVTKSGTQSISSNTTLQLDNDLAVPVAANAIYTVHVMVLYGGPAAADLKMLFRTPTSGAFTGVAQALTGAGSAQTDNQNLPVTGNSSDVYGTFGSGTQTFTMLGKLTTAGTAGNFQVEWAQNTSNATQVQVFGNSFLDLRRVS